MTDWNGSVPKVSVLMTIYNAERYLREAIDSVVAQTFGDWELIAVENGSADASPTILASYADDRIRTYFLPQNIGRTPALRYAFDHAQGEYIAILDADDVALPHRFATQCEFLDDRSEYAAIGSHVHVINSRSKKVSSPIVPSTDRDIQWVVLFGSPLLHSSVIMRRDIVCELGGYDETFSYAQDYALWSCFITKGYRMMNLPDVLTHIRTHDDQTTVRVGKTAVLEEHSIVGQRIIKAQLGMTLSSGAVKEMYRLVDRFDRLSPDEVSSALRLFHAIADSYTCHTRKASICCIRTLLSLGVLHTGIPFFARVRFIKKALGLICCTRGGHRIFFIIRAWLRPKLSAFDGNG